MKKLILAIIAVGSMAIAANAQTSSNASTTGQETSDAAKPGKGWTRVRGHRIYMGNMTYRCDGRGTCFWIHSIVSNPNGQNGLATALVKKGETDSPIPVKNLRVTPNGQTTEVYYEEVR